MGEQRTPADKPGLSPADKIAAQNREEELNRALDKGGGELPPNQIKGVLGERGLNFSKTDGFKPDLSSGISQEIDLPVIWAAIVLSFLTVIFSPVGFVILWRTHTIARRMKVVWTVIGSAWVIGALTYLWFR